VIGPRQLVLGISIGAALILCGLIPGLFQQFSDGVRNALDRVTSPFLAPARTHAEVRRPAWLAAAGAAFIVATALAYFWR